MQGKEPSLRREANAAGPAPEAGAGEALHPLLGGVLDCGFDACTTALERDALVRALRRRETWQTLLAESAAAMLQARDAPPLITALFERVGPTLGADLFFNYGVDETAGTPALRLQACGGLDEDLRRAFARLELGEALCGSCAQLRRPLCLQDVQHGEDPRAELVRRLGVRAYACHPLLAGGRLIGTLSFASRTKDRFEPDELDFIAALSQHIALASERLRAEHALRDSEQRFRATFDNAAVGIAHVAPDGRWLRVNDRLCEILGYPREELLHRTFTELTHPDDIEPDWAQAHRLIAGEIPHYALEKRYLRRDGSTVPANLTGSLVRRPDGEPDYFIAIVEDISLRKRAEALLGRREQEREQLLAAERAARAEVERATRLKDEFLATLSHELRTPLNAIVGWAHVLQRAAGDNPLLRQGLEVITRNAQAQAQLIADLLDMNRIVAGKLQMEPGPVDLARIAAAAAETLQPAAESKGVQLRLQLDAALPPLRGDAARLQQVLWNLLSNAIKFTPAGGSVTLAAEPAPGSVRLWVEDSGEGIDPAFLPHLFERFSQADGSTARRHGGLGLGLSIARQLVELHGGHIAAHSEGRGHGARFEIRLPSAGSSLPAAAHDAGAPGAVQEPAPPGPPAAPLAGDLRGVRILLVDDQPDALELGRRLLGECGARVDTAASGAAALQRLGLERPDLLLSDVGMPDMDGYGLIREVRESLGLDAAALPAIALTAFSRREDRERTLAAGFQMHLTKPLQVSVLVGAIRHLVGVPAPR